MPARQLTFDLPVRPALGRHEFLVADCNRLAVDRIDRWPEWQETGPAGSGAAGLLLRGPHASGKSHLARVWQRKSEATFVDGAALSIADGGDGVLELVSDTARPAVILDDLDRILGAGRDRGHREEALFHLYNRLTQTGGHLLVTAATPPARWNVQMPDLASRLSALPVVNIGAPDDQLLAALAVKHFSDRQVSVTPMVVSYLVTRVDRSFDALERVISAIDDEALRLGRPVTVPLVRHALDQLYAGG